MVGEGESEKKAKKMAGEGENGPTKWKEKKEEKGRKEGEHTRFDFEDGWRRATEQEGEAEWRRKSKRPEIDFSRSKFRVFVFFKPFNLKGILVISWVFKPILGLFEIKDKKKK